MLKTLNFYFLLFEKKKILTFIMGKVARKRGAFLAAILYKNCLAVVAILAGVHKMLLAC